MRNPGLDKNGFYIKFEHKTQSETGLTQIWTVRGDNGMSCLGYVKWYSPWRRYAFFPYDGTAIFDAKCLEDIAEFLDRTTRARKRQKER